MSYIYDLKKLELELNNFQGETITNEQCLPLKINLAIAERIQALTKAQTPQWVEFERENSTDKIVVDARYVRDTEQDDGCVLFKYKDQPYFIAIKGTLPEVLAAQGNTIEIVHRLKPLIVVMAGADVEDPYKD